MHIISTSNCMSSRAIKEKHTRKSLVYVFYPEVALESIHYYLYQSPVTRHNFRGTVYVCLYCCAFEEADIA